MPMKTILTTAKMTTMRPNVCVGDQKNQAAHLLIVTPAIRRLWTEFQSPSGLPPNAACQPRAALARQLCRAPLSKHRWLLLSDETDRFILSPGACLLSSYYPKDVKKFFLANKSKIQDFARKALHRDVSPEILQWLIRNSYCSEVPILSLMWLQCFACQVSKTRFRSQAGNLTRFYSPPLQQHSMTWPPRPWSLPHRARCPPPPTARTTSKSCSQLTVHQSFASTFVYWHKVSLFFSAMVLSKWSKTEQNKRWD